MLNKDFYRFSNITDQSILFDNTAPLNSKFTPGNRGDIYSNNPYFNNIYEEEEGKKTSVTPSAPIISNTSKPISEFKTPNRTIENNLSTNVQSTLNCHLREIPKQGKLDRTPLLSDFYNPSQGSTYDLVKLVAELAGNNKSHKLDPNTKRFSGSTSEDVDDWLFNIQQGFISSRIKDEDKLNSVVNFVDKVPAQILRKHITNLSNWTLFELELRNTYTKINKEHWVRSQLSTHKHRENTPFENYVNKFYLLTNKVPKMTEEEKLFYFREGLRETTKREVTCRNIRT